MDGTRLAKVSLLHAADTHSAEADPRSVHVPVGGGHLPRGRRAGLLSYPILPQVLAGRRALLSALRWLHREVR